MRPPGIWELLLILMIILLVFGATRLPQIGEALGKAIKSFRKGFSADEGKEDQVNASKLENKEPDKK